MKDILKDRWTILIIVLILLVSYIGGLQALSDMEGKSCPYYNN